MAIHDHLQQRNFQTEIKRKMKICSDASESCKSHAVTIAFDDWLAVKKTRDRSALIGQFKFRARESAPGVSRKGCYTRRITLIGSYKSRDWQQR